MKARHILFAALLPMLAIGGATLYGSDAFAQSERINYHAPALNLADNQQIHVYYFHGNVRCTTCTQIEKFTTQAVQQGFGRDLGSGQVVMHIVNVEEPQNQHYINDFELITRSVVVEIHENGQPIRWNRLDQVWQLVFEQQDFTNYIYREMARLSPTATFPQRTGASHG
ncbi:nitrophenyl compound nitroreductase subunit ArsF family protein [Ferrimonas senticii]|uniref:nitrophenyl compound nitroreductase subunit ArsF family protein n=1 Tax=Ferrimonas senticii TaxID=394566 RepID=UPI0004038C2F|nr:nitrophenyl compound nitroreductase subunit ArsF family protein [Ferrimonas senticii]